MISALLFAACGLLGGSFMFGSADDRANSVDMYDPGFRLSVARDAIVVTQQGIDRAFTSRVATYTLDGDLHEMSMHQSCCGSVFEANVENAPDGELFMQTSAGGSPESARKDTTQFQRINGMPLVMDTDFGLLPYLYASRHVTRVRLLSLGFWNNFVTTLDIAQLGAALSTDRPKRVPAAAASMQLWRVGKKPTILWYDPCVYRLYAYGESAASALVDRRLP